MSYETFYNHITTILNPIRIETTFNDPFDHNLIRKELSTHFYPELSQIILDYHVNHTKTLKCNYFIVSQNKVAYFTTFTLSFHCHLALRITFFDFYSKPIQSLFYSQADSFLLVNYILKMCAMRWHYLFFEELNHIPLYFEGFYNNPYRINKEEQDKFITYFTAEKNGAVYIEHMSQFYRPHPDSRIPNTSFILAKRLINFLYGNSVLTKRTPLEKSNDITFRSHNSVHVYYDGLYYTEYIQSAVE